MLFSLPGSPVIRFGDELRMGDDLSLEQREAVRTPMQWANEPHGGFTTSKKPVVPVIDHGVWSYEHVNVEAQRRDPSSFLSWMARIIRIRKECPEVGFGRCTVLDAGAESVLALRFDWHGHSVVTLHNFAERPREARLRLRKDDNRLSDLFEPVELQARAGRFAIPLDALDYRWFRIGGLDYAIRGERR
jgi:maltose alpha-D-glucosyltransferase/alpha-amylase